MTIYLNPNLKYRVRGLPLLKPPKILLPYLLLLLRYLSTKQQVSTETSSILPKPLDAGGGEGVETLVGEGLLLRKMK